MNELITQLNKRIILLNKAIKTAEKETNSFPEGSLRISNQKRQKRYYRITPDTDHTGEYIKHDNEKLIRALAQSAYNKHFLKLAHNELSKLENTMSSLEKNNADKAFQNLSDDRRSLISPYIITDELFAKEWQSKPFKSNPYMPENRVYDTRRGEKVRSKSEAILADILYEQSIPYHYEMPLVLKNGATRYPDFTLLNMKTRDVIYFEHFGLLDNEVYLNNCLHKLDEYRQNCIYPGKNLIFTYETEECPLDIKGIRKMLKDLLL
ncbi:MAG: hypothetical protein IK152_07435 [Lachnospiraceae bacterium]|nr:hypothetical protein [Lachnospiraceae bacterium]